jgi:hypothetical protein
MRIFFPSKQSAFFYFTGNYHSAADTRIYVPQSGQWGCSCCGTQGGLGQPENMMEDSKLTVTWWECGANISAFVFDSLKSSFPWLLCVNHAHERSGQEPKWFGNTHDKWHQHLLLLWLWSCPTSLWSRDWAELSGHPAMMENSSGLASWVCHVGAL